MLSEPILVTLAVTDVLEELGVPYAVGGSLASAFHGVMRATLDADLVANLLPEHVPPFVDALGESFYVDEVAVLEAVQSRTYFNLIHLDTTFKVDVFVAKSGSLDRAQLDRRQHERVSANPDRYLYLITAEDTILVKLAWYHMGKEVSERQWRDVLGVLAVQSNRLDHDYLHRMAAELGLIELLERALQQAT